MKYNIMAALNVIVGEWLDVYSVEIPYTKTPECIMIEKEWLKGMSDEGIELVNIILSCPEEFFYSNGKIMGHKIKDICLRKKYWKKDKVKEVMNEVARHIRV